MNKTKTLDLAREAFFIIELYVVFFKLHLFQKRVEINSKEWIAKLSL